MDIQHYYIEKGQGPPLILLHGNGQDSSYFRGQIDEFARYFRVLAVDTRGHGRTPRGSLPFTIRQFAVDLLGFMDEHRLERAHLLGFSDGANVALICALQHPERMERLILNGADLDPGGVKRSAQLPIEIGYKLACLFAGQSESARAHAEQLGLMVNEPHIALAELAAVRARTLVIAGTRDLIREEHTRLIASAIPGAELALIRGGHFIAARNPAAFNRTVLDFLRKA
ncbi:MAG: alpha/beta fold hydrolase [Firmicutes bacterium]|nr:alpha/beta fold hydrolase [Bacillota bacterium]